MSLFKKKKSIIVSPVKGQLICIEDVEDPVFSSHAMGNGFGVQPIEHQIYAPIEGKVVSIFPSKHAIVMENKQGVKILIHIGLDTGELNGEGFDLTIQEGDTLSVGEAMGIVDFDYIKEAEKGTTIVVVFIEDSAFDEVVTQKEVSAKEQLFEI